MQDIVKVNIKEASFKDMNLNKIFDPNVGHEHKYEFKNCFVTNPVASGEGQLFVCFYILEPGKENYPYYYHNSAEEVFYIISGMGTLKTKNGNVPIKEGDVFVLPANENGAHKIINTSEEKLVYIDIDTVSATEAIIYPESEKMMVMFKNFRKSYKINSEVNYLEGE